MKKTSILLIGIFIAICLGIGYSFVNAKSINTSTVNASYNGKNMTFQYPTDWNLSQGGLPAGYIENNLIVQLTNGGQGITIQVYPDDNEKTMFNSEFASFVNNGYPYNGTYSYNKTSYDVFMAGGTDNPTIYLFQKNGKTFEIMGYDNDSGETLNLMKGIVGNIQ